MGSKNRHSRELLPIILNKRYQEQYYVEPFVGGCNMIDKVDGNRIGNDINEYLIYMWNCVSGGWLPRYDYTEDQYKYIRDNKDEDKCLTGYFGFALSYGGKFFGGWCRDSANKRNYVLEAYKNAVNQFPLLNGVKFYNNHYVNFTKLIPYKSIIYCDPPYANTTKYKNDFDHNLFWDWCNYLVDCGHSVFVSEYNAPLNWTSVWQKRVTSSLTKNTGSKIAVEKLFTRK
ncbi:MAG TPA: DNA adenine methylase [Candidatus Woesebacteria bacterium]|nr:DNA adenine methylase [Candidatus Woesebacteria bacterium]